MLDLEDNSDDNDDDGDDEYDGDDDYASPVSPKPFFGTTWRVSNAVVGRRNVGCTTSKSGQPCPCQNCS